MLFDALVMASSLNDNTLDQIVSAVQANIERRTKLGTWRQLTRNNVAGPSSQLADGSSINRHVSRSNSRCRGRCRGRGNRGRGRGGFNRNGDSRTCHYCERDGHFIKFCRLRLADESFGKIRKLN